MRWWDLFGILCISEAVAVTQLKKNSHTYIIIIIIIVIITIITIIMIIIEQHLYAQICVGGICFRFCTVSADSKHNTDG